MLPEILTKTWPPLLKPLGPKPRMCHALARSCLCFASHSQALVPGNWGRFGASGQNPEAPRTLIPQPGCLPFSAKVLPGMPRCRGERCSSSASFLVFWGVGPLRVLLKFFFASAPRQRRTKVWISSPGDGRAEGMGGNRQEAANLRQAARP